MSKTSVQPYLAGRVLALLLAPLCAILQANAQDAPHGPPSSSRLAALSIVIPVVDCSKLASMDISAAVGSKTHITAAEPVASGKPAPYCRVSGYVEPMVKFEVRLPMTTWTQRFVQTGCGGLCGMLNIRLDGDNGCFPAQHGELALASTDMGHSGGMDGKFGEKDYQLRIDFAYRGVHVTTLAAKALIAAFYGQFPKYSYFSGCSDGGREALVEAQRYPQDFNGITAGAPAMNFTTQNTFYHGWNAIKNMGADGKPILTSDQLPILHQAVLKACDVEDGLKDGLISDPLSCHFDPAVVECKAGAATSGCLTHAQVAVARDIYAGAHTAKGEKLVLSGPLPGSELAWAGVYIPASGNDHTLSPMISTGTLKYLAYEKNPPAGYTLDDFQFTAANFAATTKLHSVYDATDPDLSSFQTSGGKLILWHGLADPHISPLNTIAYYTAMNRVMGDEKVHDFARLYLFPGGYHCGGGEGPFNFDLLSAIMTWVERGSAPFALVASHQVGGAHGPVAGVPAGMPAGGLPPLPPGEVPPGGLPPLPSGAAPPNGFPRPNGKGGPPNGGPMPDFDAADAPPPMVDRTRPIYPYPLTAKYNGTGSIDDAKNFSPRVAKPATAGQLDWLGSLFYSPHYETWCTGQGASMTCSSKP